MIVARQSVVKEQISVRVKREFRSLVDEGWVKKIARQVLRAEGVPPPYEVSLFFADSLTVRRLNRDYRGVDETTDVLAFYMLPHKAGDSSFVLPPDNVTRLGEVIISFPRVAQQAEEQGHSTECELALVIIHGMLHLLGYDHEQPDEASRMQERERESLQGLLHG